MILNDPRLLVLGIGVSPCKVDGVLRFEHFCKAYGLNYKIIGEGKQWYGGDMNNGMGGGQKIKELTDVLESMDNRLIVVCDTFDLIPIASEDEILDKFKKLCKPDQVLFSSEVFCWPKDDLKVYYPQTESKYKYLNSGCIMGYRDSIYKLIQNNNIKNNDDDQLYFTMKFLTGAKIVLDYKCELFQALNGVKEDIIIHRNRIYNKYTDSYPVFIHGNGPSKTFLNSIENYIEPFPYKNICTTQFKPEVSLTINKFPKIFIALYIDSTKPGLQIFLESITDLDYDNKIVYVYNKSNNDEIKNMVELAGYHYKENINTYNFDDFINEDNKECRYYFLLEQGSIITHKNILKELINYFDDYHRIICPLLHSKAGKYFTNYWGAIDNNGFYRRSDDYLKLVEYEKRGLWNCPYVSRAILFDRQIVTNWNLMEDNKHWNDIDMQLCHNIRKNSLFMYMVNNNKYGYILPDI